MGLLLLLDEQAAGLTATATDSIGVSDAVTQTKALNKAVSDTITASESLARTVSLSRAVQETAQLASDSFTDTTGTLLTAHTGESGGWTQHPASAGDAIITNAGRLRQNGASVIGLLHFAGAQAQAEYDVAADFVPTSSIASSLSGITARLDPSANTLYLARYSGSASAWQILKLVNGSATTLNTSASFPLTASQSYRVVFQIRNATKKIFVDGVEVASTADNAITGAGRVGVRMFDSSLNSDASSMHIDNLAVVSPSGVVLADAATASPGVGRSATDTLSLSESVTRTPGVTKAISDSLALTESVTRTSGRARNATDAVTLSETLSRGAQALTRPLSDSVSFSESTSVSSAGSQSRSATDSIVFSESLTRRTGVSKTLADTLTFSESTATRKGYARTPAETLNLAESLTKSAQAFTRSSSDTLAFSDTATGIAAHSITLTGILEGAGASTGLDFAGGAVLVDETDSASRVEGAGLLVGIG